MPFAIPRNKGHPAIIQYRPYIVEATDAKDEGSADGMSLWGTASNTAPGKSWAPADPAA
jgi:hypothetical protein